MSQPLVIDYYTDVLCVWAWIAQKRVDQLQLEWGDKIQFRYHYLNLFANTDARIGKGWQDRGGFDGFGQHVIESATPYPDAPVNPSIWQQVRPKTSLNAHLLLKALEICCSPQAAAAFSVELRRQFFVHNQDIGNQETLFALAEGNGYSADNLRQAITDGSASAALASDYQTAQELAVKGSPSWIMNQGRQTLYGNVGYRVLNANIKEFLQRNEQEASWC